MLPTDTVFTLRTSVVSCPRLYGDYVQHHPLVACVTQVLCKMCCTCFAADHHAYGDQSGKAADTQNPLHFDTNQGQISCSNENGSQACSQPAVVAAKPLQAEMDQSCPWHQLPWSDGQILEWQKAGQRWKG